MQVALAEAVTQRCEGIIEGHATMVRKWEEDSARSAAQLAGMNFKATTLQSKAGQINAYQSKTKYNPSSTEKQNTMLLNSQESYFAS